MHFIRKDIYKRRQDEASYRFRQLEQKRTFCFLFRIRRPLFRDYNSCGFTDIYRQSKELNVSFFLYSLHFLLKCANETDAFKLRIEKDSVVRYDTIHISPTIGREDGTFGFGFFEYDTNINRFIQTATQEIERVKNGTGLSFSENTDRQDVIHYSALPWFAFSEMKHATSFKNGDSVPRISTGKLM